MKTTFFFLFLFFSFGLLAQKKPLDHSVYDSWQSIGERMISNDGRWVVYTVCPQVGDTILVIQSSDAKYKKEVEHSKNAVITEDSRFVIFKIRPLYKDLRDAWIKKKKAEDMPKDSLGIVELGKDEVLIISNVKNYKTPQKGSGWVAYQMSQRAPLEEKEKDSEQFNLVLRNTDKGSEKTFPNISEYHFNKDGSKLLMYSPKNPKDSASFASVLLYDTRISVLDTLSRGGNDFKNFVFSDDGSQIAYLAERDAMPKALQKFYRIWYWKEGMDSATMLIDRNSVGMKVGMVVSEFGQLGFSKSGKRLFFGVVPIQPPKDTSLIDIDVVKLDIWHYNDDYLQTVQTLPNRLRNDLQQSFLAVYDFETGDINQLGRKEISQIIQTNEGDGDTFVGVSDYGKRIESQWLGVTRKDVYAIDVKTGKDTLIKKNLHGQVYPSSTGKYIMWYDRKAKNYFVWDGKLVRNITSKIKVPLYNIEGEHPDDPPPYGVMGWHEGDSALYIYDKYDVWKVDPLGKSVSTTTTDGRKNKIIYRYVQIDPEKKFFKREEEIIVRIFNELTKGSEIQSFTIGISVIFMGDKLASYSFTSVQKSKNSDTYLYTKENFISSPDLYVESKERISNIVSMVNEYRLSYINPQQQNYLWGTAELFKWKAYNGKQAEGIVYKPENFDPKKKYPMICYFYEELDNTLHNYIAPAPIRSAINIPYYVSNGYIIFVPNIDYTIGYPGKSAYNYVVSGARALVKKGFVDSTKIAIQGHSWGGYQVAYLITATKLFKAAWSGAPVVNMTSAYGGIRWESGLSRQWQYEKSQSRIGATLWEKPNLYIENSPLFHLKKVTTPVVIMHNDADGAVPWYQGIEMFTALRRLGKKVWMLNYNGEAHGLVQRKNRLDYHIRMQQFFDWILKGAKPAKWITEGVPAVMKGRDWGLEVE